MGRSCPRGTLGVVQSKGSMAVGGKHADSDTAAGEGWPRRVSMLLSAAVPLWAARGFDAAAVAAALRLISLRKPASADIQCCEHLARTAGSVGAAVQCSPAAAGHRLLLLARNMRAVCCRRTSGAWLFAQRDSSWTYQQQKQQISATQRDNRPLADTNL